MSKLEGGGLIIAAIVLVILGVVLRWDLIDWLIDATGFLLIVVGVILGIVGLIQMFTGGRRKSSF
jgi:protein-S-isoprenylcysteine O-methyltransferase Ste14